VICGGSCLEKTEVLETGLSKKVYCLFEVFDDWFAPMLCTIEIVTVAQRLIGSIGPGQLGLLQFLASRRPA
jgi:hypothetical protein